MGVYNKILKQAYEITLKYKFLWIFGLFLSLCLVVFGINFPNYFYYLILILAWAFYIANYSGLIVAIKAILDKQETSWGRAYKAGKLFFGRIFVIDFVVFLTLFLLFFILVGPAMNMNSSEAGITMTLSLLVYYPILALGLLINILTALFIVVYDLKINESVKKTLDLIGKQIFPLITLSLFFIVIDLPALFLAQFMVGLRGGWALSIVAGIAFLLFQTVFMVFQQVVWILVFLDLLKPQKIEDESPVAAPEVIS